MCKLVPLKADTVVEENGARRSPGVCLRRSEQYNSHPGFTGDTHGSSVLVSGNGNRGLLKFSQHLQRLPIFMVKLEDSWLEGVQRACWFGCRG